MQNHTTKLHYNDIKPDLSLLKEIPISYAKKNLVLPLSVIDGKLYGLVCGENGFFALREIALKKRVIPSPLYTDKQHLIGEINRLYGQIDSAEEVMQRISDDDFSSVATEFESPKDILELTTEAPIIRLINALLRQAVKDRASDIHIEPYENEIDVRMRIDGVLKNVLKPPKIIQDALISRVKIMAGLDIAERRLPQDGRIRLLIGGKDIDIRVSIIPTVHGERVVMRLLDRRQGIMGLSEIGLDSYQNAIVEEVLKNQSGIILVTGPTGSGKTTTLYAALNKIHTEQKNIITVEDPVEYQLKGIGQIQVQPRIGLTFASGLRSILRQDPDIIMVGEIRDIETAEIAVQASLTGHLVLSTLHTNDASSAITRLIDMGVEPFLLSSSLICVIAQRLVRIICNKCKYEYTPTEQELTYLSQLGVNIKKLYKGKGCEKCRKTGYYGRIGVFEVLKIENQIRRIIKKGVSSYDIKEIAIKRGMKTLQMAGLEKVYSGETSLEEVIRVTEISTSTEF